MAERELKFGTLIKTDDGQTRVVIDVRQEDKKVGFETLGIVSLEPLLITFGNGSGDPRILVQVLERMLSLEEVFMGVKAHNEWVTVQYKEELTKLASTKRVIIV